MLSSGLTRHEHNGNRNDLTPAFKNPTFVAKVDHRSDGDRDHCDPQDHVRILILEFGHVFKIHAVAYGSLLVAARLRAAS